MYIYLCDNSQNIARLVPSSFAARSWHPCETACLPLKPHGLQLCQRTKHQCSECLGDSCLPPWSLHHSQQQRAQQHIKTACYVRCSVSDHNTQIPAPLRRTLCKAESGRVRKTKGTSALLCVDSRQWKDKKGRGCWEEGRGIVDMDMNQEPRLCSAVERLPSMHRR